MRELDILIVTRRQLKKGAREAVVEQAVVNSTDVDAAMKGDGQRCGNLDTHQNPFSPRH
jgi:hypothetical protein